MNRSIYVNGFTKQENQGYNMQGILFKITILTSTSGMSKVATNIRTISSYAGNTKGWDALYISDPYKQNKKNLYKVTQRRNLLVAFDFLFVHMYFIFQFLFNLNIILFRFSFVHWRHFYGNGRNGDYTAIILSHS